ERRVASDPRDAPDLRATEMSGAVAEKAREAGDLVRARQEPRTRHDDVGIGIDAGVVLSDEKAVRAGTDVVADRRIERAVAAVEQHDDPTDRAFSSVRLEDDDVGT